MVLCCRLVSCCCGCTLKSGTVFVGVMQLVGAISFLLMVFKNGFPPGGNSVVVDIEEPSIGTADATLLRYGCIVMAAFNVFLFVFSVMLLYGVGQRKARLLLPWIICESTVIIATLVIFIWMIVVLVSVEETWISAFFVPIFCLVIIIRWYFLSVVHSHYKNVQMEGYKNENI